MKKRTRFLILTVVCLMFLSTFTVSADTRSKSASGKCGNNLTWVLYSDGELVISGSGAMYDWQWWVSDWEYDPVDGGYWKTTDTPWEKHKNKIQKLTVKSGVESIGAIAFAECKNLKNVTIEQGTTIIRREAFSNCEALTEITLQQGLETIAENAFANCKSLKKINIPESTKSIGSTAFYNCPLMEVTVSEKLSGGPGTFTAKFDENSGKCGANAFWKLENGVLTISGYGRMDNYNWGARGGRQWYPPWSSYLRCSCYFSYDNSCKHIEKIIISEGITRIGSYTFSYTDGMPFEHNQDIYISSTVKNIGSHAFTRNSTRSTVTKLYYYGVEADWEKIHKDEYALYIFEIRGSWNKLKAELIFLGKPEPKIVVSGVLGETIKWVIYDNNRLVISGNGAIPDFAAGEAPWFAYAGKINTVIIDEGITGIGASAFYGCSNIYSLSLPGSITSIGYAAFFGCRGLSGFIVPANVTAIGDYAFFGCTGLKYVTLYPGIAYIGAHAFDGCTALEKINLPDTITYIGDYAFSSCAKLTEIVIPTGVTELRPYVFNMCTGLLKVTIHSKVENVDYTTFCGCVCQIYGYSGSYAQIYADSLKLVFVPLKFIWSENSGWGTEELKKADELRIFPESLKEKDLSQSITREEFAAIAVKTYEKLTGTPALPAIVNPFTDTNSIDVLKAYNAGITTGVSETQFAPNALLNREQAATMLARVFKKATIPGWSVEKDSEHPLTYDVPDAFRDDADISPWAKESVYFMTANGIVSGVGNNLFAPKNTTTEHEAVGYANATREQALIIAVRMIEKLVN